MRPMHRSCSSYVVQSTDDGYYAVYVVIFRSNPDITEDTIEIVMINKKIEDPDRGAVVDLTQGEFLHLTAPR